MGVRLYPRNDLSNADMERLAGVPLGTSQKLMDLEERHASNYDAFYEELFNSPDLRKLHSFQLSGWGKFDLQALAARGLDMICGSTEDPELIEELCLSATNFPAGDEHPSQLDMVCWG